MFAVIVTPCTSQQHPLPSLILPLPRCMCLHVKLQAYSIFSDPLLITDLVARPVSIYHEDLDSGDMRDPDHDLRDLGSEMG